MSSQLFHIPASPKIKINWARECAGGTLLSAVFTIFATYSGTNGVAKDSLAGRMHDVMILGGATMAMVCGFAGFAIIARNMAEKLKHQSEATEKAGRSVARPFGVFQAVKFMKIFMP